MMVLGIDPGYGRTGYALIDHSKNGDELKTSGLIETSAKDLLPDRLYALGRILNSLIVEFQPDIAGIESLFVSKNVRTAVGVAEARGVILAALAGKGVKIFEITPNQVKLALTSYGAAPKSQVSHMTMKLLGLKSVLHPDDVADAAAIALATASYHR